MKKALVITDSKEPALVIKEALSETYKTEIEDNIDIAVAKFKKQRYDATFFETDLLQSLTTNSEKPFREALRFLKKFHPSAPIIVFSDPSKTRATVKAVRSGANDYLLTPIQPEEVRLTISEIRETGLLEAEVEYLKDQFWSETASEIVVTKSPNMQAVYQKVKSAAPTASTILLTGETGVGKSLIAQLIHEHSNRKSESCVSVHCGAIPDSLVESELFGHEKGSFTGAIKRKLGRFEIANKGTIFLDEIGTVTASTQIKLLKVLQDSTFQRVGGESDIKVDVRVIAATNENLKEMAEKKEFRSDLYYRLNVFPIEIPPLRKRREDIPALIQVFLNRLNKKYLKNIGSIDDLTLEALVSYDWPGNIRELENIIERGFIIETSDILRAESLPQDLVTNSEPGAIVSMDLEKTLAEVRDLAVNDIERQYLKDLLSKKNGKINETAEVAGVGVRQIHKLMAKYGLQKDDFKEPQAPATN